MPKQLTEQQKQQSADRKARFRQLVPATNESAAWSDVANAIDDGEAIKAPQVSGRRIDEPAPALRESVTQSFAWARPAAA
jgi:uncharacterized protein YaiL (DUF2058 family)